MKKRIIAFTLFLMMVFSMTAMAATFTDITATSHPWAYNAVKEMNELGVIKGTTETTFAPDNKVTKIQALLLMARIIGYNSDGIKENIDNIYAVYEDELSKLSTTYKNELAFLAFSGAFDVSEFEDMDLGAEITRQEAAMFLSKVDGINDVSEISDYEKTYSDDASISSSYKPYVYYVKEKGYMTGVSEGVFSPKTTVTRAQIATMLYRILPNVDYTYKVAAVDTVDVNDEKVQIYIEKKTYDLPEDAVVRNNALVIDKTKLYKGIYGVAKTKGTDILQMDVFVDIPVAVKTVDGLITHIGTTTNIIQIENIDDKKLANYNLNSVSYVITINGEDGKLSQLRIGDYAVLGLDKSGKIIEVTVSDTDEELNDLTIEKIEITDSDSFMTVVDANGNTRKFDMNKSDPVIRINGAVVGFSSLNEGDKISKLQLLYNRVKSVDVLSEISATKGTLKTIHISDESYIVIVNNKVESTFVVNKDTEYYVFGERKTLYDLQLGQNVSITMEGKNVAKIEVTLASQSSDIKGTVLAVNKEGSIVTVQTEDGDKVAVYVSTKLNSATRIIDNNSTATRTIRDIADGASITVFGAMVNGVFEAKTIVYSNPK